VLAFDLFEPYAGVISSSSSALLFVIYIYGLAF